MTDMVTVRLYAAARAAAGTSEAQFAPTSLLRLIEQLQLEYPPLARVLPQCSLLVDGLVAKPGSDVPVPAGATVDVLPPFAGG